ncbi:MAG: hypothetical protein U1E76_10345 [Planctomycetota bacterium]
MKTEIEQASPLGQLALGRALATFHGGAAAPHRRSSSWCRPR